MKNISRGGLKRVQNFVKEIDSEIGTPFFLYDLKSMKEASSLLVSSAENAGLKNTAFYLAFFSLPNIKIISNLLYHHSRLGINCNTPEEVYSIKKFGFNEWDRVVFSGGVLPEQDLITLASSGCTINVASKGNLDKLKTLSLNSRIGLRLDLTNNALKGIKAFELDEIMNSNLGSLKVESLHAYFGTEIEDIELLIRHAEVLINLAGKCDTIKELNFGGGFFYDYSSHTGVLEKMVDFENYFREIKKFKDQYLSSRDIKFSWEPGRAIFAGAGFYITKTIEVRENGINSADVYVDGSFTNIPVMKFRNRNHLTIVLDQNGRIKEGTRYMANICGATTLSTDTILPGLVALPEVMPGDYIIILDSGAYGRAGSYNFLGKSKPPEVLMEDGSWSIIRKRQAFDHLLEDLV